MVLHCLHSRTVTPLTFLCTHWSQTTLPHWHMDMFIWSVTVDLHATEMNNAMAKCTPNNARCWWHHVLLAVVLPWASRSMGCIRSSLASFVACIKTLQIWTSGTMSCTMFSLCIILRQLWSIYEHDIQTMCHDTQHAGGLDYGPVAHCVFWCI